MHFTLDIREQELKKRFAHPYEWGQKQNDAWDEQTDFIYHIFSFEALVKEVETRFHTMLNYKEFYNYTLNRWYNFWSAKAIEQIFCSHPIVKGATDNRDRLRDFKVNNINFDHKTSTYPRGFNHDLTYGQKHPKELVEWFYRHQSQQRRKHHENRIFIILYSSDGEHWKLKAELGWIEKLIKGYLDGFDETKLFRFTFDQKHEIVADVIWAIN
ncbi:MAG: hypothetical protein V1799_13275 [bacterium]